jgi:UDP-N-acetylglucosamine--N-acetylmuramyl-(pentapeptide) pyrophosphoryl-undecaprenol N-acetylglucosamine transferase
MSDLPRIVIAGGGSGGHVFPALAIAEAIERGARVEVIFAGTARGLEAKVVPARGYRLELLEVLPIKGGGPKRAVLGVVTAARAVVASLILVRRLGPRAVVSVGGYAAGPVALAGGLLGVAVCIVEPNATPGLANRLLRPIARRAYVSWGAAASSFASRKTRRFGVPLRRGFTPVPYEPSARSRVLVLGGSQGAAALNERVPQAMGLVCRAHPGTDIVHQAGAGREEAVKNAYAVAGITNVHVVPFLDDMPLELARADLVISRSGAGTVAEIAAVGRPAIFVPFPYASDDHQLANAEALEHAGGALCLLQEKADALRIAGEVSSLLSDPERRVRMARAARAFGSPDAATLIAKDLCELAGIPWHAEAKVPQKTNGAAPHAEVH